MKKLLSLIISIALLFTCSAMNVFAEYSKVTGTFDITLSGESGHTYKVYQIFKGDLATDGTNYLLSNIVWGDGVTSDGQTHFGNASKKASNLTNSSEAKEFAKELVGTGGATYIQNGRSMSNSGSNYKLTVEDPGYYLIVEESGPLGEGSKAYTDYIVEVVKNVTVTPKNDSIPTIKKEVKEGDTWGNTADASIGDKISFKITITLPEDATYSLYSSYKLELEDKLPASLTYDDNSMKIFNESTEVTEYTPTLTPESDGTSTLKLVIANTKATPMNISSGGTKVIITYDATLNNKAVLGSAGNSNNAKLTYSNNSNDSTKTGTTNSVNAKVFTYGLDVNKVDSDSVDTKLEDAQFKLYKNVNSNKRYAILDASNKIKEWTDNKDNATVLKTDSYGKVTVSGLDKGEYYLTEVKAPAGYNKLAADIRLIIGSTIESSTNSLTDLTITVDSGTAENGNAATGIVSMTVKNKKGAVLPSTGGIGTTIFYVAGGALVAGAVVLLVLKKREN